MPLVIPVFIPHQGCPRHCLFCNQVSISGEQGTEEDKVLVHQTVDQWLARSSGASRVQVAFYGGSFTCLPRERQERLLLALEPYLASGKVTGVRLSTRPDCVTDTTCSFLKKHGVETVELGVQSLDDQVLAASLRGHSRADVLHAVELLQEGGMELGIQLMPGLPGEDTGSFLETVRTVAKLQPDFVRLYPTLVVEGSGLARLYREGGYRPLTMNRAIALCRRAREILGRAGVPILRMGLQAGESLEKELLAGPYHPAFGELVTSRLWFRKLRRLLAFCPPHCRLYLTISERDLSALNGTGRATIQRLQALGLVERLDLKTEKTMQRGTLDYVIA